MMKKTIFVIALLAIVGLSSCNKEDLTKPVKKQTPHRELNPVMDPPGHHYTSPWGRYDNHLMKK